MCVIILKDRPIFPISITILQKMTEMTPEEVLAIDCTGLTYAFAEGLESALDGVDLQLKKGDRCLVVGANGGTSSQAVRPVGRSLVP
jgi:NADPH:quinone reductase-like Zn-dependent oxidoreductase